MSQILGHLTLLVLLLNIRLNSSASILRMQSLTHEKSSMRTTGSNITSFATLKGIDYTDTTLTGYVTVVFYKGASCSDQIYAQSDILNSCYRFDDSTYRLVTATSSSVVEASYTDSKCTMGAKKPSYSYTDGACDTSDSTKVYISSSSVWNSDSVTATVR